MTGEKNRYSTVEKLWKLDDETLKTPKHDELVLWLLNKNNFLSVFSLDLQLSERSVDINSCEELRSIHEHLGNDNFWDLLKKKEYYKDIPDTLQDFWFAAMQEYHEFVSDIHVLSLSDKVIIEYKGLIEYKAKSEVPISTYNHFIVGYWDLVVTLEPALILKWSKSHYFSLESQYELSNNMPRQLYIEVKPRIDSFGATLRQLNTYQDYVHEAKGKTYLFTPDLRFKDAFESQGIHVISPPIPRSSCANEVKGECEK